MTDLFCFGRSDRGSTEATEHMGLKTIFYQECPTCGRSLRIPVKYFGSTMSCSHCSGEFVAQPQQQHGRGPDAAAPIAADAAAVNLAAAGLMRAS